MFLLLHQYLEMYKRSIEDPAGFWSDIASSEFFWKQRWDQQVYSENLDVRKGEIKIEVSLNSPDPCLLTLIFPCLVLLSFLHFLVLFSYLLSLKLKDPSFPSLLLIFLYSEQWFKGGITNICYNCLDRNIEAGLGEKIALYWEGNEPGFDGTLTYTELLHKVCQVVAPS